VQNASTGDEVLNRPRRRLRPSFAEALAAGGGVIVWIGALLVALDVFASSGDGWTGAVFFVALAALAIVALIVAPASVQPGCMSVLVLSVPTIFGFLIFPTADSFGDARAFLALTIITWATLFAVSNSRGRPILIGLVAAVFYVWMVGEVANTDEFFSTGASSLVTASGSTDSGFASAADLGTQPVTLDDLDPANSLYPLAQSCAAGDDAACDQLWNRSEFGSDFERFASSCGGDPDRSFPCSSDTSGTIDSGTTPEFDGQFEITPTNPLDATPVGTQHNRALEIGLVSLLFGALYLAAVRILDFRRLTALGTAFVLPAVAALIVAAVALGVETESAAMGGLITIAVGIGVGVVGFLDPDRRFTTWAGGAIASVGALIVAADVAPESNPAGDNLDLIGAGLVVVAFGLGVILLAWIAYKLLDRRPSAPPSPPAAQSQPAPEPDPAPI
jgi:MFS family permease